MRVACVSKSVFSCVGGSICEPLMQTTTAGRVMLIHHLVVKGDLQELKKELAKDMGLYKC